MTLNQPYKEIIRRIIRKIGKKNLESLSIHNGFPVTQNKRLLKTTDDDLNS